jgi:hypothetical protein
VNSFSFGKVRAVSIPIIIKQNITTTGKGDGHSFTIGATIVIDLAIIPHVPTDVFLLFDGNILSSVKDTYVVVMKDKIIPIFKINIKTGINFSSKLSLESSLENFINFI